MLATLHMAAPAAAADCAAPDERVAWVEDVKPNPKISKGPVSVKRKQSSGSAKIELFPTVGDFLCTDDEVLVAPGGILRYRRTDGAEEAIDASRANHRVQPPALRNQFANLVLQIWEDFLPMIQRVSRQTVSRGGSGVRWSIPGLEDGSARLAPGRRAVTLVWSGGAYPFELELIDPQGVRVYAGSAPSAANLAETLHQHTLPAVNLTPGLWTIRLRDFFARDPISGRFRVDPAVTGIVREVQAARGESGGSHFAELEAGLDAVALRCRDESLSFEGMQVVAGAPRLGFDRMTLLNAAIGADCSAQRSDAPG